MSFEEKIVKELQIPKWTIQNKVIDPHDASQHT